MNTSSTAHIKIAILADSLALPRGTGWGDIPYEATYPYLLLKELRNHAIISERCARFNTIQNVLDDWLELVELRKPEVVIVHVGLVDCAPRVFKPRARDILQNRVPQPLKNLILHIVGKYRRTIIKIRPNNVYISQDEFRVKVAEVVRRARHDSVKGLFFVNIISPPDDLEYKSPGYRKNVEAYNAILAAQADNRLVHLIDLNSIVRQNGGTEQLTVDGMHINGQGHQLLAHALLTNIGRLFDMKKLGSE